MADLFSPGTKINRFILEAEIGRGGMGIVYRATDPALKRPVAIKVLAPHLGADPDALARFQREAESIAALKHSHVAMVYEFGEFDHRPYIVMEWLEGRTLKSLLEKESPLPLERSLRLLVQLTDALDYAHRRGVIHRDLKPANIMITANDQVTIVDFGLAWLESAASITASGSILGTPRYMSPEQIEGKPIDNRSDLYSLAIILYEMLAGSPPFDAPSPMSLLHKQVFTEPPPITEMNPAIPIAIESTLNKALSKEPDARFQSAQDLRLAFLPDASTGNYTLVPHETAPIAPSKKSIGLRRELAIGLIILFGALGIFAFNYFKTDNDTSAPVVSRLHPTATPSPTIAPVSPTATTIPDENSVEETEHRAWGLSVMDSEHSHFSDIPFSVLESDPRWQIDAGEGDEKSPLVMGDEFLIISAMDGTIEAVNRVDGAQLWETRLGAPLSAPPIVLADEESLIAFFSTTDGALYALNVSDASLLWRMGDDSLQGVIGGLQLDYTSPLYALTDSGLLHFIDPQAGEIDETAVSLDVAFNQPPSGSNPALFLVGQPNNIYAIERATKSIAWQHDLHGEPATPVLSDGGWGFVVVGTADGWLHAFSSLTGKSVWKFDLGNRVRSLATDWEYIFAASSAGKIYAWDAWENSLAWQIELENNITAELMIDEQNLMIGTNAGEILYISTRTGKIDEMRTRHVDDVVLNLLPIDDGWLFVRTPDSVFAFAPQGE